MPEEKSCLKKVFSGEEKVDLHIHTTASDGCWTPRRLLFELRKKEIRLFSVTDHDSVANVNETALLAGAEGITFLPGVEISSTWQGRLFHILGYGVDVNNRELTQLLAYNTRLMQKKDDDSVKLLAQKGLPLDYKNYLAYENDPARGGWKALNYLIDQGLCHSADDFFANLFQGDLQVPFPIFPDPVQVIDTIVQAGGLPVLAHPGGSISQGLELGNILEDFLRLGIAGVECFHPEHDREKTDFCVAWAKNKDLLITGGSDCHGEFIPRRCLGRPELRVKDLQLGFLCMG